MYCDHFSVQCTISLGFAKTKETWIFVFGFPVDSVDRGASPPLPSAVHGTVAGGKAGHIGTGSVAMNIHWSLIASQSIPDGGACRWPGSWDMVG